MLEKCPFEEKICRTKCSIYTKYIHVNLHSQYAVCSKCSQPHGNKSPHVRNGYNAVIIMEVGISYLYKVHCVTSVAYIGIRHSFFAVYHTLKNTKILSKSTVQSVRRVCLILIIQRRHSEGDPSFG